MPPTISELAVDPWAVVNQNSVREGAVMELALSYHTTVYIDLALYGTTAHIGTRVIVEISSSANDDEFWAPASGGDFIALVGTNETEAITDAPLMAGSTTIAVASTTGFQVGAADQETLLAFLRDSAAEADSELVRVVGYSATPDITILDGTKRNHAATSLLSNIARSIPIELPPCLRARVLIDNKFDTNGDAVHSRTRLVKTTAF